MVGQAFTVFEGTRPEPFKVRVVSVMPKFLPKQDIILIRAEDPRVEVTGIAAGMSGSPVYVDGKLMGAIAYGWSFAKEPLCGVTPIETMRAAGLRPARPAGDPFLGQDSASPLAEPRLQALSLPLAVSGLPDAVMRDLGEDLRTFSLVPVRAGERLEDSAGLGVQLVGLPIGSELYRPLLTAGRWLEPGDDRVVVISQDTAEKNRLAVGDVITLDLGGVPGERWEIIGTYKIIFGGGFNTEEFYAPLPAVAAASGQAGEGTRVMVRTTDRTLAGAQAVAGALRERFEDDGLRVDLYTSSVTLEDRAFTLNQFSPVVFTLLGLAALLAGVGAIGLTSALSISVMERTREIGVLRALGARSSTLLSLYLMEGVLQSLLSWGLAVPLAYGLAQPLARQMGQTMLAVNLDYAFSLPAVFLWLAVTLVIGVVASLGPARDAARISVRESLAYA